VGRRTRYCAFRRWQVDSALLLARIAPWYSNALFLPLNASLRMLLLRLCTPRRAAPGLGAHALFSVVQASRTSPSDARLAVVLSLSARCRDNLAWCSPALLTRTRVCCCSMLSAHDRPPRRAAPGWEHARAVWCCSPGADAPLSASWCSHALPTRTRVCCYSSLPTRTRVCCCSMLSAHDRPPRSLRGPCRVMIRLAAERRLWSVCHRCGAAVQICGARLRVRLAVAVIDDPRPVERRFCRHQV
jgi:hypothetical protein